MRFFSILHGHPDRWAGSLSGLSG